MANKLVAEGYFGPLYNGNSPESPQISVALATYPSSPDGSGARLVADNLVGLIDTGSGLCLIDKELAISRSLPLGVGSPNNVITGNKTPLDSYKCTILIRSIEYAYAVDMAAQSFISVGVPFHFILGMDFLRHFDLEISKSKGIVRLTYVG
jgi:hypothetical protein